MASARLIMKGCMSSMRSKRNLAVLTALCLHWVVLFSVTAQPIDRPVATLKLYESEVISQSQFRRTVETMEKQAKRPLSLDEKKQILDQLINERLLVQAALKEKIVVTDSEINNLKEQTKALYEQQLGKPMTDEEFKTYVEKTGYNWDAFLKELQKGLLAQKYVKNKKAAQLANIAQPSDKEVSDYYTANQHLFISREMVRIKQIYINPNLLATPSEKEQARKKALAILRELKAGASFDNYWEIYDDTGRIKIGGLITTILRRGDQPPIDAYGKEYVDAVFALNQGAISDLITSKAGYHIVSVVEKIPFKVLNLDDLIPPANALTVRNYIRQLLAKLKEQDSLQQALNEVVSDLRKLAEIKVYNENLVW